MRTALTLAGAACAGVSVVAYWTVGGCASVTLSLAYFGLAFYAASMLVGERR